jgi:hypothetical protein
LSALKRAAAAAWRLSVETGTPFFVIENGRVVNRNPKPKRRAPRRVGKTGAPASGADRKLLTHHLYEAAGLA